MADVLTATKGRLRRDPRAWMARATRSLPVPLSPKISTGALETATSGSQTANSHSPLSPQDLGGGAGLAAKPRSPSIWAPNGMVRIPHAICP
jgi:hypothetical protein